jgi:hypothetical protein
VLGEISGPQKLDPSEDLANVRERRREQPESLNRQFRWGALVIDDKSVDFSNRVYGHSARISRFLGNCWNNTDVW